MKTAYVNSVFYKCDRKIFKNILIKTLLKVKFNYISLYNKIAGFKFKQSKKHEKSLMFFSQTYF